MTSDQYPHRVQVVNDELASYRSLTSSPTVNDASVI